MHAKLCTFTLYIITYLYFYHDYKNLVQFNLKDELAKGDHILEIPKLFPPNAEFEELRNYTTPFNTPSLRVSLVFAGGLFGGKINYLYSLSLWKFLYTLPVS